MRSIIPVASMFANVGEVYVRVKVHGPHGSIELERVLVDTGATHSMLDQAIAGRLGIQPEGRMEFDVVGGVVELPVGVALLEIEGRSFRVPVALGDHNIVGVTALEALGLTVDPLAGRLVPRRGILFHTPLAAPA